MQAKNQAPTLSTSIRGPLPGLCSCHGSPFAASPLLDWFRLLFPRAALWKLPSLRSRRCYERLFTPIVTLWYLIFQRLHHDSTLEAVVLDAHTGGADGLLSRFSKKIRSQATPAYNDARQRLPLAFLQEALSLQVDRFREFFASGQWRGLHLCLLDGSTLRLRPHGDIAQHFPPHSNQYSQGYWCLMRVVVCFCPCTGAALAYALGALHQSEQALAHLIIRASGALRLYIGDRNFGVYSIAQAARAAGSHVLVRLTQRRARKVRGAALRLGDHALEWKPSRQDQQPEGSCNQPIGGRLLVVEVQRPGFRSQTLYLFTSLEVQYLAPELVELYGLRWQVELNLRYLKSQMALAQLESKSAQMAHKEWVAGLMAYNLIRAAMLCAALHTGANPLSLSFSAARRHVQLGLEKVLCRPKACREQSWEKLLQLISKSKLPKRRKRRLDEPRAQRRVPSVFPNLKGDRQTARKNFQKN